MKRENIEKTDTTMCLKEKTKDLKNIKKIIAMLKSLNIIMNKIVFLIVILIVIRIIMNKIVFFN